MRRVPVSAKAPVERGEDPLVAGLLRPGAYPHPVDTLSCAETHISWVLLAGPYAYKVKKPLRLDFLDFSTLERRRHFCREELRLNRRLAPRLYLEVVPITGSRDAPRVGGRGEAIEFAVRMVRFPADAQLDRRLAADRSDIGDLRGFAERLARFHAGADRAKSERYGGAAVARQMRANLRELRSLVEPAEAARIDALAAWTRAELRHRRAELVERAARGFVRECHGDLHLSNLVALDDGVTAFDCIEFNEALRWIDVIDDVAFLIMDLEGRGRLDLGFAFADAYLAHTGDYGGARLIDLYRVYRSLVRAKVAAIGGRQSATEPERTEARGKLLRHLELADHLTEKRTPLLVLMHGLPASGKSWIAERLVPRLPAFRLRSDRERKRLAGLTAEARSRSPVGGGLYTPERDAATYGRLAELARGLLETGHGVIVDASFSARARRETFYRLASEAGARCVLLDCRAPRSVLYARIAARAARPEVSEADAEVLDYQTSRDEPIGAAEPALVIALDTSARTDLDELAARMRPPSLE